MAKAKKAVAAPSPTQLSSPVQTQSNVEKNELNTFPIVKYASLVIVHLVLVSFTAIILPSSTFQRIGVIDPLTASKDGFGFVRVISHDPTATLAWLCFGLLVLQLSWGGSMRKLALGTHGTGATPNVGQNVGAVGTGRGGGLGKSKALKEAWLATLGMTIVISIGIILLGAPFAIHLSRSFLLGLMLSILTVYAPVYAFGLPSFALDDPNVVAHRQTFLRIFAELSPVTPMERALVYPVVGTVLGAWAGIFPLALDWDEPWQAYPLPPAYGAIFGYIVASAWSFSVSTTYYLAETNLRDEIRMVKEKAQQEGKKVK